MAFGTATALIGSAVIGAGASIFGASKASSAAKAAGQLEYQAAQDNIALQQRIFDQTRADNEPFRQVGVSAAQALAGGFGLGPAPSMTGGAPAPLPAPAPAAGTMTAATDPKDGRRIVEPSRGQVADMAPSAGQPDYSAYLSANPDVAAEYQSLIARADPNSPWFREHGLDRGPEGFAEWHYQNNGQNEGRALPTASAQPQPTAQPSLPAPTMTGGAPPGYADPTAPGGYGVGPRPDIGPRPAAYQSTVAPGGYTAPARMTDSAAPTLDLSLESFRASPDYAFRKAEQDRALDATASRMGGRMSGSRIKAALERSGNLADGEWTDWRDHRTGVWRTDLGQYNTDLARKDARFGDDRAFGYGMTRDQRRDWEYDDGQGYGRSRDAYGDWTADRARSDGLYDDDRRFVTGRYDQRNAELMRLAGFGTNANSANNSAAQSFASNAGGAMTAGARARGDAAIQSGNAWANAGNNVANMSTYLAGRYMTGGYGGGGSSIPNWSTGVKPFDPVNGLY